ncbi:MAG: hypothetical protein O3B24_01785 [Verrucomicrobia bacterium]|nr:hypothetical protein [Verrucomicrobiota bacterium]
MATIDRLAYAAELCRGKRVLDVGGWGMTTSTTSTGLLTETLQTLHRVAEPRAQADQNGPAKSPFLAALARIRDGAAEHCIMDAHQDPGVAYQIDLNQSGCVEKVRAAIEEYRPEVILCMETLEHVNYHFEIMNEFSRAVSRHGAVVYITLPNNGNWVLNALGWNYDHSVAFFRDIAHRFVTRSDLGQHAVVMHGCMQKYLWYWWLVYLLAFAQPLSWGFTIRRRAS